MQEVMERAINGKEEGGHVTPPVPHKIIYKTDTHFSSKKDKQLTKDKDDDLNRVLFIAPRGFAKSTNCSRFFPLWLALYKKKKDIFLVSATVALAKENMRIIRQELEVNEKIIEDFGEQKSDKWTEEQLHLKNGTIIRAKGQGFQIRGFRPDIIVCDDLEDENIIYSRDQREKLDHWFFRTLLPALKPEQHLFYVGTKLNQQSLMSKLEKKSEFLVQFYAALTNNKSIWEDYWPTDKLKKLRKEIGSYAFQAEYQNNPISLSDQPVKPHYIKDVSIEGEITSKCLAIDPAISEKESSDYRAFVLFGRTEHGFREIYSERGRWGIDEQVDRIIGIWERFEMDPAFDRIVIEEVAFQKVYRDILLKESRSRSIFLPISTAELGTGKDKRPKDKVTRLLSIVHLFEQQLVQVNNPDLYEELVSFPTGDYDDLVDGTVYSLYWLMNARTGKAFEKKQEKGFPFKTKESFFIDEIRPGVFMKRDEGEPTPPIATQGNFINYDR